MTEHQSKSREAFEAWYREATGWNGELTSAWCAISWDAWQAAEQASKPPQGWKLVPIEPTQAMCQEGQKGTE